MKIDIIEKKIIECLDTHENCVIRKDVIDMLSQGVKDLLNACVGKYEGKNTIIFDKYHKVEEIIIRGEEGWLY